MWVRYWLKAPVVAGGQSVLREEYVWFGDDLASPKDDAYLNECVDEWVEDELPEEKYIENVPAGFERVKRLPQAVATELVEEHRQAIAKHLAMIENIIASLGEAL